mgnify:CR=1 FL=1
MRDLAAEIDRQADRLDDLVQKRIDPERFHVVKDEIVRELRRAAGRIRADASNRKHSTTWRPAK